MGWKAWTRETLDIAEMQELQDTVANRFDSAAQRTTQLPAPTEGMLSYLRDLDRYERHNGTAWFPLAPRTISRFHVPVSSGIPAGAARESGVADGPVIAGFTGHAPGTGLVRARFRASCPSGGWLYCVVKVNGVECIRRLVRDPYDQDREWTGVAANIVAGANSLAMRVEANGAAVSWIDGDVSVISGLVAE